MSYVVGDGQRDLFAHVAAQRPADPEPLEVQAAAVRVLARVAVLEAGAAAGSRRPPRAPIRGRVAVAALLLFVLLPVFRGARQQTRIAPAPQDAAQQGDARAGAGEARTGAAAMARAGRGTWYGRAEAAVDGDAVQRARVLGGGRAAREALLQVADFDAERGAGALALLRIAGRLRGRRECAAVERLARRTALRPAALALLAGESGRRGVESLGGLLRDEPAAEADAVAALLQVAAQGRREAALEALLSGARAGRARAAAAALEVGGSGGLTRVLAALPPGFASHPGLVEALGAAPETTRARLLRLAAHGEARALLLAVAGRLPGTVDILAVRSRAGERAQAESAVEALVALDTTASWVCVGRALDGPGRAAALRALRVASPETLDGLVNQARASHRDAPAACAALAAAGPTGTRCLVAMAAERRLAPLGLAALEAAPTPFASLGLGQLAARRSYAVDAIDALRRRLTAGHAEAGDVLLGLAQGRQERSVLRALEQAGAAARAPLERAASEERLGGWARATLERLDETERRAEPQTARLRSPPRRGPGSI
jgi:hypothetical protein